MISEAIFLFSGIFIEKRTMKEASVYPFFFPKRNITRFENPS